MNEEKEIKQTSINELNAFLKGEQMAIESYQKFIHNLNDRQVSKELQKIQNDHQQHANKIAQRIKELEGKPGDDPGVMGKMALVMADLKNMGKSDPAAILKDAYAGESKGIEMAEEIVKGDLDHESEAMIRNILDNDRGHLETLNKLMRK